ncbi:unnamed protein product [Rhizoctonia solani]|uniref:Uncharacterized protein n=1 Tax=Rhizoctonia solani TaxID=456999 RepID=A0A8H3AID4_9AGAM|nr:unnamed protein product [Rhizoctonia solani]
MHVFKTMFIEATISKKGQLFWEIFGRDPRDYEDPETFNPDRYLDPDVPRSPVFGWGRRTLILFNLALAIFGAVIILEDHVINIQPWVTWEFVHANWHHVVHVPVTSVAFFAFFGFGKEARTEYGKSFDFNKKKIFRIKSKSQPVLPVSAPGETN